MKKLGKIFRILGTILLIFLLAVIVLVFNARLRGEAPNVFGYQVYIVSSPSMEPELMVGDVILVKETDIENIKVGDTITYKGEEGELRGKFITHKVVEGPTRVGDRYKLTTRGIKPGAADDPEIYDDQVLGVYLKTIPFLDKVYSFFLKPYGIIVFIFIIIILFGYELIALVLSYNSLDYPDEDEEDLHNDKSKKKKKKIIDADISDNDNSEVDNEQ